MAESLDKPARWGRMCIIAAAVYAVVVALAVWIGLPTERQIESDTAWNAIWAIQQHEEKYRNMPLGDIRRRLYRGLSDEQVTAGIREFAATEEQRVRGNLAAAVANPQRSTLGLLGSEEARPRVAVLMEEAERTHAARMATLESDQRTVIAWGLAAWAVPMVLLYALGPRLLRPRRRTLQRF